MADDEPIAVVVELEESQSLTVPAASIFARIAGLALLGVLGLDPHRERYTVRLSVN